MSDAINPDHYKRLPVEAIEIIESAIDNAPSAQDGYLHGQVLKYALRCWHKNGIEDLKKAKWYLDRLIEHCDESLLDANKGLVKAWTCEDGKAKQVYPEPKWTFKVGDWVRINKPSSDKRDSVLWSIFMDGHDKEVVQVKKIEDGAILHGEWFFPFDWLEPAEAPKQPQPPDGWRWLEVGEVIRKGDRYRHEGGWYDYDSSIGEKLLHTMWPSIRRNRFKVSEKVVRVFSECVYEITAILDGNLYEMQTLSGYKIRLYAIDLAPYIEEAT